MKKNIFEMKINDLKMSFKNDTNKLFTIQYKK